MKLLKAKSILSLFKSITSVSLYLSNLCQGLSLKGKPRLKPTRENLQMMKNQKEPERKAIQGITCSAIRYKSLCLSSFSIFLQLGKMKLHYLDIGTILELLSYSN